MLHFRIVLQAVLGEKHCTKLRENPPDNRKLPEPATQPPSLSLSVVSRVPLSFRVETVDCRARRTRAIHGEPSAEEKVRRLRRVERGACDTPRIRLVRQSTVLHRSAVV